VVIDGHDNISYIVLEDGMICVCSFHFLSRKFVKTSRVYSMI
jgi:hypothetical protein